MCSPQSFASCENALQCCTVLCAHFLFFGNTIGKTNTVYICTRPVYKILLVVLLINVFSSHNYYYLCEMTALRYVHVHILQQRLRIVYKISVELLEDIQYYIQYVGEQTDIYFTAQCTVYTCPLTQKIHLQYSVRNTHTVHCKKYIYNITLFLCHKYTEIYTFIYIPVHIYCQI